MVVAGGSVVRRSEIAGSPDGRSYSMRTLGLALLMAAVGGGLGYFQSRIADFHPERERFATVGKLRPAVISQMNQSGKQEEGPAEEEPDGPRVTVLNGEMYDFGSMERGVTRSHTFLIKNTGTKPLEILLQRTTCKCTLSTIGKQKLAPGEVTEVTLEWSTKDVPRNQTTFSQLAEIETNDPDRPILELRVRGEITEKYRLYPPQLEARELPGTEENRLPVRLFHYGDGAVRVVGSRFEPERYGKYFSVESEPLSPDALKAMKGATGGLLLHVVIRPGLPVGPVVGTLFLDLEAGGQKQTVDIPLRLNIVSDIVLAGGPNFDRYRTMLDMRKVSAAEGKTETIFAFVKGPHRQDTKLSVKSVDPADVLEVTIGEPQTLPSGRSIKYTIHFRVPPGAPRTERTGRGSKLAKVVLSSTHPTTKEIRIYVRLSVK